MRSYLKPAAIRLVKLSRSAFSVAQHSICHELRCCFQKLILLAHLIFNLNKLLNSLQFRLAERKWKAPDYMTQEKGEPQEPQVEKSPSNQDKPRELTAREERLLIQAKYNNREVPYQSDNLTFWERKDEPPLRSRRHK